MRTETVAAKQFDRWAGQWDQVYSSMPDRAPFLQSRFLIPTIESFGTGNEVVVLSRSNSGKRFGAVVVRTGPGIWTTFQPSQLPLGPLVAEPGVAWEDIRQALASSLPGPVATLGFTQTDPALFDRPSDNGSALDFIETAWVDIDGSFEAYWAARGKNLRHNLRKQRSRLAEAGVQTRLECITESGAIAGAIADYGRLEGAGWKGELGTAVREDNGQGAFYSAMLEAFMKVGKGRIWRYWFDSTPVAIDLCIESDETLVILKTTYAEDQKQYSPAFLMREEYFRSIFDEGRIRRVEFFGRRMEWHQRWTDNVRMLYHVNFDRWPLVSWMRRLRSRGPVPQERNA